MEVIVVTVLLGLALFKLVDFLEELVPSLARWHTAVVLSAGVAVAFGLDWRAFDGLRDELTATVMSGFVLAGATSVWRAIFHWLGTSEGDEPVVRHAAGPRSMAA